MKQAKKHKQKWGYSMQVYNETVFEHESGKDYYGVSTGETTVRNRLAKLAEQYPTECIMMASNEDGSVVYHIPSNWVRFGPPRKLNLTDEQRAERAERIRIGRNNKRAYKKLGSSAP